MSAYDTPTRRCPYCGDEMQAEFVDIGIGMQQCGPYICLTCEAYEIGPNNTQTPTEEEAKTGYYKGGEKQVHTPLFVSQEEADYELIHEDFDPIKETNQ